MTTSVQGWTTIAENPLVLVREYSFGAGMANAMAVGLPDNKLMIISPPTGVPASELKALEAHGKVVALLEFNGAHHLGLPDCKPCFPDAVTYAAPRAAERIAKKGKNPGKIEPVDALTPLLGDKVSVFPVAGDKLGDVLVRVKTEKGTLLFAGDFIANIRQLPKNFMFRLVFKLTDSGPGFKVFRLFFKMFVADRKAARDCLIHEVEANPPAVLVPAHGDVIEQPNLGPTLVSMLRAAV